jgi:predicted DNA-binding transcriptional regulator YafY
MPMANPYANSVKFLKAVNLLASPKGTTIKDMMENLCISRRSVFRLLDALQELGFPLLDDQHVSKSEKTYRLLDTYVLNLPNMAIPNPCFSEPETEILLSMLDFCMDIQQSEGVILLKGIRQKVNAMTSRTDKGSGK